ncbi:hypothetical protein A7C91_04690 [Thermococcus piezophilus]|uniref:Uncharacterized protein n=1 Tax=Thermococcus piezophilus TaxID=1712654 RepID=A0A172WGQ4_9EURY|nr:hypothetical protein A7C91_04690 [Thermococcus piezophilus]
MKRGILLGVLLVGGLLVSLVQPKAAGPPGTTTAMSGNGVKMSGSGPEFMGKFSCAMESSRESSQTQSTEQLQQKE